MLDDLYWQQPWWLLLAPLPWLLPRLARIRGPRSRLERFIERTLWPRLLQGVHDQHNVPALFVAAWLLACVALAGPMLKQKETDTLPQARANIAIVLDISPSMRVQDVSPSRLDYSKHLLNELLNQLGPHRLALIVFSANAYVVSPLTTDKHIIRQQLDAMDPSLVSVSGSNLARALELATTTLNTPAPGQNESTGGMVLLVSDGEIHDQFALQASRFLRQHGHRLYTLGVGTEQGGAVPFASGRLATQNQALVVSHRQRQNLQQLARAGGGRYQDLQPDAWPPILAASDALKQRQQTIITQRSGTPLFAWLLAPALALFVWLGIRRPALYIWALCLPLLTLSPPTDAAPWRNPLAEQNALQALKSGDNTSAADIYSTLQYYSGYMGAGVAAYNLEQWPQALTAFEQALAKAESDQEKAQAAYNIGNVLVQSGRFDAAARAYKEALFWQPGYTRANHNLALLTRHEQTRGGERDAKSDHERHGPGEQQGDQAQHDGDPDIATTQPGTARKNEQRQGLSQKKQRQDSTAAQLMQSLAQWQQGAPPGDPPPGQAWQQFRTLREDHKTMLKRRFESEDSQARGLVVEKPW